MKIEVLLSKSEFEHVSQFAKTVGYEIKIVEEWPDDKVMCEFSIAGRSAHFLFHAGMDYSLKNKYNDTLRTRP